MDDKNLTGNNEWVRRAMALIDRQKTLVLATSDQNMPWAAPVYYLYISPAFYFFSSPKSKHIGQALDNRISSAALYAEAEQWDQIEGIQMVGRIIIVDKTIERLKVTAGYLNKFPTARSLMKAKQKSDLNISAKVRLYAFYPEHVYYMNNQSGFGSRQEIALQ